MKNFLYLVIVAVGFTISNCGMAQSKNAKFPDPPIASNNVKFPMELSDAQWKDNLTDAH